MQTSPNGMPEDQQSAPYFYAVGLPKFVVLWLGTLGLYGLYWFYQHWQIIRVREGGDFKSWQRTLLAGSFCEPLLLSFQKGAEDLPGTSPVHARTRAIVWLAMTATVLLGPPLSLICPLAFLPLIGAQRLANQVNAARTPDADQNTRIRNGAIIALLPALLALTWGFFALFSRK
jgi:hypothetical protein